jgi:carbon starvation protein CstA
MAGGWGGELMRRESEFMVLDGMMTVIAAICLTVAHPGIYFPTISSKNRPATVEEQATANEKTSSMSSGQDEPAMAERA